MVRTSGGLIGRQIIDSYVYNRFEDNVPAKAEFAEYMFQHWQGEPSGEFALNEMLLPGAFAKRPLIDRLPSLLERTTIPCTFVYGDRDWMDIKPAWSLQTMLLSQSKAGPLGGHIDSSLDAQVGQGQRQGGKANRTLATEATMTSSTRGAARDANAINQTQQSGSAAASASTSAPGWMGERVQVIQLPSCGHQIMVDNPGGLNDILLANTMLYDYGKNQVEGKLTGGQEEEEGITTNPYVLQLQLLKLETSVVKVKSSPPKQEIYPSYHLSAIFSTPTTMSWP